MGIEIVEENNQFGVKQENGDFRALIVTLLWTLSTK